LNQLNDSVHYPDLHRALSDLLESGQGQWDRSGVVIGWALRWVLLCCGVVLLGIGILDRGAALLPDRAKQSGSGAPAAAPVSNTIVYATNESGHVVLGAAVNGIPVRMLVDTGASLVTLTQADARAAGIAPAELIFNGRAETANGSARMAPVTLREIRIDQLSIYDVPAAVLENLNVSLLGMSFLSKLQAYEMRDGKLTISW
jgi:aspartyl protease family protein